MSKSDMKAYWKENLGYLAILLSIWFLYSFEWGIYLIGLKWTRLQN